MKQKHNDRSEFYKDWTTRKLKKHYRSYDHTAHELECFGTKDVAALYAIEYELNKRGITIGSVPYFIKE